MITLHNSYYTYACLLLLCLLLPLAMLLYTQYMTCMIYAFSVALIHSPLKFHRKLLLSLVNPIYLWLLEVLNSDFPTSRDTNNNKRGVFLLSSGKRISIHYILFFLGSSQIFSCAPQVCSNVIPRRTPMRLLFFTRIFKRP